MTQDLMIIVEDQKKDRFKNGQFCRFWKFPLRDYRVFVDNIKL